MGNRGNSAEVQIEADSSSAKSNASRRSAGKVGHPDVRELWVQDRVAKGEMT